MRFGHAWVRTTKGEAVLANRNRYLSSLMTWVTGDVYWGLLSGDDISRTTEIILSFDDDFEEFSRRLKQLSKEWEASGLREIARQA